MQKKRNWLFFGVTIAALGLALAACPGEPAEETNLTVIAGKNLTELVTVPVHGESRPDAIANQPEFTGTVAWEASYDEGVSYDTAPAGNFVFGTLYRAIVILTPKSGYTFNGTLENSFTHQKGAATNMGGGGGTTNLVVTIHFPKASLATDVAVDATNLLVILPAPVKGGTPPGTLDHTQYSGTITWETENGAPLTGEFQPATTYKAIIALTVKTGYTLIGLSSNSFTHSAAQSVSFNLTSSTVTVLFNQTTGAGENDPVNLYNLTSVIPAPVYQTNPVTAFETDQYTGTAAWSYVEGTTETPLTQGAAFDCEKPVKALVTLSAKTGFTFTGVPANAFVHTDSTGTSNAAGSGSVTITFAGAPWTPGTVSSISLTGKDIKICCYPAANRNGAQLINNNFESNDYWDYGWNGEPAANFSDWPDILKDAAGVTFNGDECGHGHETVLLPLQLPRAHFFTLDLGAVTNNIVQFGMYPRNDNGERWPIQFEVFYSDTEIGAIPGEDAKSLGIIEWGPAPEPRGWRYADLYTRTSTGRGFSARYIHVRIYAENKNGIDASWITTSFSEIHIGVGQ